MSVHWLGYAGTVLVVLAYVPQVTHLLKEHCSAGLSVKAYLMWFSASVLLLAYAITLGDPVFTALQGYQALATVTIFVFCRRYRHELCEEHGGETLERRLQAAARSATRSA